MTFCFKTIGIKGNTSFDDIINYFQSLGGDVILINPTYVCGKNHLISAVEHAKRSLLNGTNRSNGIFTETAMYIAGEKQISKAIKKIKPEKKCGEYAAVIINIEGEVDLTKINMIRDDSILNANKEKADTLGLDYSSKLPLEDLALESVAVFDVLK
ncbi:MAG: hypothetical protein MJY64_02310 [archaeon]|nr:hypothetical protein [archaeon]